MKSSASLCRLYAFKATSTADRYQLWFFPKFQSCIIGWRQPKTGLNWSSNWSQLEPNNCSTMNEKKCWQQATKDCLHILVMKIFDEALKDSLEKLNMSLNCNLIYCLQLPIHLNTIYTQCTVAEDKNFHTPREYKYTMK